MPICVNDPRWRVVLLAQGFGSESALLPAASCLAPEEKVECGAGGVHRSIKVTPLAFDPDVGLIYPPTVVGRFEFRAQTSFHFRGVTLHPPPDGNVVDESSWARKRDSAAAERRLILRHRV